MSYNVTSIPHRLPRRHRAAASQDGVALAILVWFLAAMSLLVAGIVMQARVDIKLAQLHAERARIEAAADGAIQVALAASLVPPPAGEEESSVLPSQTYNLGGFDITVSFTPVSGLISVNDAPEELLVLLFTSVPDLDENAARELAANVVEWRTADSLGESTGELPATDYGSAGEGASGSLLQPAASEQIRHARFEAPEDLLLVSGITRTVFDAVRDAIYVGQTMQSGVDWLTAPVAVLSALGGGDLEQARALADERESGNARGRVAPDSIDLNYQVEGEVSSFRVDAVVMHNGAAYDRRRWVDRERSGSDGLPWSFFRTEALRVQSSTGFEDFDDEEDAYAGS